MKKTYKIKGMHCASCASMIELDLEDAGISAKCSYQKETLEVDEKSNMEKLIEILKKSDYSISGL